MFAQWQLRFHIYGLTANLALILGRTKLDAHSASCAVLNSHLQGVLPILQVLPAGSAVLEGTGCAGQGTVVVDFGTDDGVGADQHTFTALDTNIRFPNRNFEADVALFPLGGGSGERAVNRHGADR